MADKGKNIAPVFDLPSLPVDCAAQIVSLTSIPDACTLPLVSRAFKSVADSDAVWAKFLLSDYQIIVSRASEPLNYASNKELFRRFRDHPILIDDGRKSFWLDKQSHKKCYMLGARDMTIIWGSSPEYWSWTSLPDSRFPEVACLTLVWWLELRGKIHTSMLSPGTKYAAYLVYKMKTESYYGFCLFPGEVSVHISGEDKNVQNVCMDPFFIEDGEEPRWNENAYPDDFLILPRAKKRQDGWLEIELGHYFTREGDDCELEMELMEVRGGVAKSGMIVQGIEIRPKRDE